MKPRSIFFPVENVFSTNLDYSEDNSIIQNLHEDKRKSIHRSTYSMDEFKLKSLTTPSKPSHKRTISGTHTYFTEIRSFGNKSPTNNSEISQESNHSMQRYAKTIEIENYETLIKIPKEIEEESQVDFPEQDSPLGLEEFEDMIEIITKLETEKLGKKHQKIKDIKDILLSKLKKSVSLESMAKYELLSTERLSDLISGSFNSNHTQIGPGSLILLNDQSLEYNNFIKGMTAKPVSPSNSSPKKTNLEKIDIVLTNICGKNIHEINKIKRKIQSAKWAKSIVVIFRDCDAADDIGIYGKEFINYRKIDGGDIYPVNVFKPQIESELILDEEDNQLREIETDEEPDAIILYKS